nr:uncharacterized protein LOC115267057 [Aedes albopictus]
MPEMKTEFSCSDIKTNKENGAVYNHNAMIANESGMMATRKRACTACGRTDHQLRYCQDFRNMTPESRVELVRKCKLCKVCLNDHGNAECRFRLRCTTGGCTERHNPLLHSGLGRVVTNAKIRQKSSILFRVLPVKLTFRDKSITTLALLDEGSSITMVEKDLADDLGAEGIPQKLEISWTGDVARVEEDSRKISLKICAVGETQSFLMNEVCTVEELMLPEQSLDAREMAQRYEHLRDIPVMSYKESRPRILIGLSNLHAIAPTDARLGGHGEPIAVKSLLGWTIYGPIRRVEPSNVHVVGHHDEIKALKNLNTTKKVEEKPELDERLKWTRYRNRTSGKHKRDKLVGSYKSVKYCGRTEETVQGFTLSVRSERYVGFQADKQVPSEAKKDCRSIGSAKGRWKNKTTEVLISTNLLWESEPRETTMNRTFCKSGVSEERLPEFTGWGMLAA